jgi:glycosyltransferase involved in cell wall biosynthesis
MNILLIEPEHRGHYVALHINLLINEFDKRGWGLNILTYKESINSEVYKLINKDLLKRINFFYLKKVDFSKRRNQFYLLYVQIIKYFNIIRSIKKIILKNNINHIYFVTADHIDKILSIFGRFSIKVNFSVMQIYSKIYLNKNISFFNKLILNIKKLLLFSTINIFFLKNFFIIDFFLYKFIKNKKKNNLNKVVYIPDPGELKYRFSKIYAQSYLKLNKNNFYILVYGAIKISKGIKELLNSAKNFNDNTIIIIIAGEQTDEVKYFLKENDNKEFIAQGNIIILEGFKSYREEAILFFASDAVWVSYSDNFIGSSAVLYQAGAAKKPVIVNKSSLLGYVNKKYKIGVGVNVNNLNDIINKIKFLCNNKKVRYQLGQNNYILSKKHSGNNFAKIIANKIHNAK